LFLLQIATALQAARDRVLLEIDAIHNTKHAALTDFVRDVRTHQNQLTVAATRATDAQRQPNLQVFGLFVCVFHIPLLYVEHIYVHYLL
jgi:hypothetical protein